MVHSYRIEEAFALAEEQALAAGSLDVFYVYMINQMLYLIEAQGDPAIEAEFLEVLKDALNRYAYSD